MTNPLTAREEIATRIACAMLMSPQQADPMHRLSAGQLASAATDIAAEIIDHSEYQFKKAREAGKSV